MPAGMPVMLGLMSSVCTTPAATVPDVGVTVNQVCLSGYVAVAVKVTAAVVMLASCAD